MEEVVEMACGCHVVRVEDYNHPVRNEQVWRTVVLNRAEGSVTGVEEFHLNKSRALGAGMDYAEEDCPVYRREHPYDFFS